ncbi:MAG TPA: hypothetical protein VHL54_00675 [Actinomycetota bacterium]|nr:hypothetical protein [Actinomycetota bacterium]
MNAVPADSGGEEDSDRIDALLSSALADQARERRMLVETVFGAKAALVKAEEELAGIRELINRKDEDLTKRDDALLAAIAKNNESVVEAVTDRVLAALQAQPPPKVQPPRDAGLTLRIEAIEEAILQLAQRIAELGELPGQLRRDLEVSAVAIGERIGEESASLLADIREDQVEVVQTLASLSESATGEVKQAVNLGKQEVVERIAASSKDVIETAQSTAELMVEHLTGYLVQRDDQLYRVRDQRLIDLFNQLGDTLGRPNRKKLAKALGEEYGTSKPLPPPPVPAKPPPLPKVPRTFRQPEPTPPPLPAGSGRSFQDLKPPAPFGRPEPASRLDDPRRPDPRPVPFGDPPSFEDEPPSASLTQALANPLSRAELARDYLIDTPSDLFGEDVAPPAAKGRRKTQPVRDEPPIAKSRSGPSTARTGKPPATPRGRRKV